MDLKKTILRELRGLRPIHIDSITVRMKPRFKNVLEVIISPAPPKGSVDTDIVDDELVVKFHRSGTLGKLIVVSPGMELRRIINIPALRKRKIKWS